ncbi:hypothetical protein CDD83_9794 [Cordyceps sp. RAO-2017]|nr:hypothetical protein CDD83_9794 [Cordyceps sp. RAO-2017]
MLLSRCSALLTLAAAVARPAAARLDPDCAPGGNFDLRHWYLQLPTGLPGRIDTVPSKGLQGCHGYNDSSFYTDRATGEMVLKAPGHPSLTGCATTGGSKHCRTELREVDKRSGRNTVWSPGSVNILGVTIKVVRADDGRHGTAIGQVFALGFGPLAEMYYSRSGRIVVGVKPKPGAKQRMTSVGQVPPGTSFHYEMSYSRHVLSVSIDGTQTLLDVSAWASPSCYFKSGNYNQARTKAGSEVRIAAVNVTHA